MVSSKQMRMQVVTPMMRMRLRMIKEATRIRINKRSSSSGSLDETVKQKLIFMNEMLFLSKQAEADYL